MQEMEICFFGTLHPPPRLVEKNRQKGAFPGDLPKVQGITFLFLFCCFFGKLCLGAALPSGIGSGIETIGMVVQGPQQQCVKSKLHRYQNPIPVAI